MSQLTSIAWATSDNVDPTFGVFDCTATIGVGRVARIQRVAVVLRIGQVRREVRLVLLVSSRELVGLSLRTALVPHYCETL